MDGDTAVLAELDNGTPEAEQPIAADQSALAAVADPEAPDATDHETVEAIPTDPDELTAYIDREAGRRAEELAKPLAEEQTKSAIARAQESARQRADHEAYQRNIAATSEQGRASLANQFVALSKDAIDRGLDAPDPARYKSVIENHQLVAETIAIENITRFQAEFLSQVFPDFAVPQDLNAEYATAQRNRDPRAISVAINKIIMTAGGMTAYQQGLAEGLKQAGAADKSKAVAAGLKAEGTARSANAAARPTSGLVTATGRSKGYDPATVLDDPTATREAKRAAYKAKHGIESPY